MESEFRPPLRSYEHRAMIDMQIFDGIDDEFDLSKDRTFDVRRELHAKPAFSNRDAQPVHQGITNGTVEDFSDGPGPAVTGIRPTPFVFADPASIPPRPWLHGRYLARGYVSATIAPGAVGKSTHAMAEGVAMAAGRRLLTDTPHQPLNVWVWNGEDDPDELRRRITAVMLHFDVRPEEIEGRLFIDSGRDTPIRVGSMKSGEILIATPVVGRLEQVIRENRIDVCVIDPFVSAHSLPENDNGAMDAVVKAFAGIAHRTGCAFDLIHHSRKLNGTEADIDSARGGSAIAAAVRSARVLNPMSVDVARQYGIPVDERRQFVRVDDAKANLAPPGKARWFKLIGVPLGNRTGDREEDWVAVPEAWTPPDMMEGVTTADLMAVQQAIHTKGYRENSQAAEWAGIAVGRVLGLNASADADKHKLKVLLKAWIGSGALVVGKVKDTRAGRDVSVIEVGEWASSSH